MKMKPDDIIQYAEYILNHYDRNSRLDIISLAKDLEKKFKKEYDSGFNEANEINYWPDA